MQILQAVGELGVLRHETLGVGRPVGTPCRLGGGEELDRDVDVGGGVKARQDTVEHTLLVAHVIQLSELFEAVLLIDRLPHMAAVVPRPPLGVQVEVEVVAGVCVDVAAHIEPELGERGIIANLLSGRCLQQILLLGRQLFVRLVRGWEGEAASAREASEETCTHGAWGGGREGNLLARLARTAHVQRALRLGLAEDLLTGG
mmetsp:Transcript_34667/g.67962  ORF Transcript_34667/g.67962 Transcript_34667/m.67962 type:complete len:202 (-) Transcript_34667:418-1023(-)